MQKHSFNIKYERDQAEDLKKRAIALKDLGFTHQADLLMQAAHHAEAKALLLHRIDELRTEARKNRRNGMNK